jgi:hypothetical protein
MNARGVAMLMAVSVIAALGTISLSAYALARMERAAGVAAVAEVQARGAAEAALADAMAGWDRSLTPLLPGQEAPLASVTLPGPATGRAVIRALGGPVFSLNATGSRLTGAGQPLASVRVELLVRLDSTAPDSLTRARKFPLGWRLLP